MKKILLIFPLIITMLFGFIFLMPNICFAEDASMCDVDIKNTNVNYDKVEKFIEIDEHKKLTITENITVTYEKDNINVGLSRNVSRLNKITRIVDGKKYVTKVVNSLKLLSVKMDGVDEYNFLETTKEYYYINTGADLDYKVGQHIYEIVYTYDMGADFISAFDDFTFDIMDYGFKSKVDIFEAHVTFPKAFEGNLSFRTNNFESVENEGNCTWQVGVDTINVLATELQPAQGLTMQLILPNNYFATNNNPGALYWLSFSMCFVSIIAVAVIVLLTRRPKGSVETVEFLPPKNLNPIDVSRIYRGKPRKKDLASLIISWCDKGLISIEKNGKKDLIITKLKEFPDLEIDKNLKLDEKDYYQKCYKNEKAYFNAIFPGSEKVFDTKAEKYKENYKVSSAAEKLLNHSPTNSSAKKKSISLILTQAIAYLPYLLFSAWFSLKIGFGFGTLIFLSVFLLVGLNILILANFNAPIVVKIVFKILFGFGFTAMPIYMLSADFAYSNDILGLLWIAIALMCLGIAICLFIQSFDSADLHLRGQVLGFKRFLIAAEVEKLEMLIEENPNYYYDILPYCYVFGITKKMQSKFKALEIQPPQYLQDNSYSNFASACIGSMAKTYVSSSSGFGSSGGSGFGGGSGGSSGGGGGGGGCGGR